MFTYKNWLEVPGPHTICLHQASSKGGEHNMTKLGELNQGLVIDKSEQWQDFNTLKVKSLVNYKNNSIFHLVNIFQPTHMQMVNICILTQNIV